MSVHPEKARFPAYAETFLACDSGHMLAEARGSVSKLGLIITWEFLRRYS